MSGKNTKSFTLAEVLITLVIIGIIAAITVPVVIQNCKRQELTSKLKKFYSTMTNALKLAEIKEGVQSADWEEWDSLTGDCDIIFDKLIDNINNIKKIDYESLINGEGSNFAKKSADKDGYSPINFEYQIADGMFIGCSGGPTSEGMDIIVDLNGDKAPNELGRDVFWFYMYPRAFMEIENSRYNINLKPFDGYILWWGGDNPTTREGVKDYCRNYGWYCSRLLLMDGLEFKNDYPLRL